VLTTYLVQLLVYVLNLGLHLQTRHALMKQPQLVSHDQQLDVAQVATAVNREFAFRLIVALCLHCSHC